MSLNLSPTNVKLPKCPPTLSPPAAFGSSVAPTLRPASRVSKKLACLAQAQAGRYLSPEKIEIVKSLDGWAQTNILNHLNPVEKCWQPHDFLPDSCSDGFHDQIQEIRERAKELPDDYFVVLVGDMVTEENVPTYLTMLNEGVRGMAGETPNSFNVWNRGWTAEENRHGDLLHQYLFLCGRVDMRQVQKTVQHLIGKGMDIRTDKSPYLSLVYTSFQERATFVSHGNTARLARTHGDLNLAKICGTIAADEKRHEIAYTKMVEKLFEVDPDETMLAFGEMMRKKILMPAHFMYDGRDDQLFDHFTAVAQRIGVYTASDYADIVEHLVRAWRVESMTGLSSEAQKEQEYVCGLAPKIRRLDERARLRAKQGPVIKFSWIHDREVQL